MALPNGGVTVEVAFGSDPLAASPVWTDITAYVEGRSGGRTYRGRSGENEDVQPGTLSLVLDNSDGRFTAGLTSSPYYPNVTINRRIRVSAVHGAVTYRLFDGHVDRWPVEWQNGVRCLSTVTATDRTKLLARRPLRSLLEQEVLRDAPVAFYPMQESGEVTALGDVSGNGFPTVGRLEHGKAGGGDVQSGTDGPNGYRALSLNTSAAQPVFGGHYVSLTSGDGPRLYPGSTGMAVELWVRMSTVGVEGLAAAPPNNPFVMQSDEVGSTTGWMLRHDSTAGNRFAFEAFQRNSTDSVLTPEVTDAEWHHLAVSITSGKAVTIYLDGVGYAGGTMSSHLDDPGVRGVVLLGASSVWNAGGGWQFQTMTGQLAHVAFYDKPLTADRVLEHYNMGRPQFEELSSARVSRLAGYGGIPTGTIETGSSYVSVEQDTSGKGVMDALLEVARSENGLVFIAGDGTLTFHSRAHRQNQAVSVTLDAAQDEVNADLEFELSDATTVNDIAVDRPRGGPVRTVDTASVATFGTYAEQVATILTSDDQTQAFGEYQIHRRATPSPRAGRVSVDPFTDNTLYPTALGTELGARVRLSNLPATAPASSVDVVVEGVEHRFSVDGWVTSWDTSPADTNTYFVWDTGVWDSDKWAW